MDDALLYATKVLKIDADGAPNSCRVDGKGLSNTCDGVLAIENGKSVGPRQLGWEDKCHAAWAKASPTQNYSQVDIFGFAHPGGLPQIQGEGDPLPGQAYVSTTSVNVPGAKPGTQRSYIDATEIPYIVLPGGGWYRQHVADGAIAAVYRPKTGKFTFAVFGDTGGALDEASVRLHEDLGGTPIVMDHGVPRASDNIDDPVIIILFPAQVSSPRQDAASWRVDIALKGAAAFDKWGGLARLRQCGFPK